MKKYLADCPNRLLREKATMEMPTTPPPSNEWTAFNKHIASLNYYPASWLTPEMDGKEMVYEKDFVVEWWSDGNHSYQISLPLPAEAAKEEDDLATLLYCIHGAANSEDEEGKTDLLIRVSEYAARAIKLLPSSPSPAKGETWQLPDELKNMHRLISPSEIDGFVPGQADLGEYDPYYESEASSIEKFAAEQDHVKGESVDIYSGDLNTERIATYRKLSAEYNVQESTVRDIFCKGADWFKSASTIPAKDEAEGEIERLKGLIKEAFYYEPDHRAVKQEWQQFKTQNNL